AFASADRSRIGGNRLTQTTANSEASRHGLPRVSLTQGSVMRGGFIRAVSRGAASPGAASPGAASCGTASCWAAVLPAIGESRERLAGVEIGRVELDRFVRGWLGPRR